MQKSIEWLSQWNQLPLINKLERTMPSLYKETDLCSESGQGDVEDKSDNTSNINIQ